MEIHSIFHHKTILGSEIYAELLFLHAFTGRDTTSSIYGVGKAAVFKNLILNKHLQEVALVFTASSRSHEEIQLETKQCLLFSRKIPTRLSILYATMSIVFKGNTDQAFNSLQHKRLVENVATAKYFVEPKILLPAESAKRYHSFRTYFQMMQWNGKCNLRAVD